MERTPLQIHTPQKKNESIELQAKPLLKTWFTLAIGIVLTIGLSVVAIETGLINLGGGNNSEGGGGESTNDGETDYMAGLRALRGLREWNYLGDSSLSVHTWTGARIEATMTDGEGIQSSLDFNLNDGYIHFSTSANDNPNELLEFTSERAKSNGKDTYSYRVTNLLTGESTQGRTPSTSPIVQRIIEMAILMGQHGLTGVYAQSFHDFHIFAMILYKSMADDSLSQSQLAGTFDGLKNANSEARENFLGIQKNDPRLSEQISREINIAVNKYNERDLPRVLTRRRRRRRRRMAKAGLYILDSDDAGIGPDAGTEVDRDTPYQDWALCWRGEDCTCEFDEGCGDECRGMCGRQCSDCWIWVCASCDCQCVCYEHDVACCQTEKDEIANLLPDFVDVSGGSGYLNFECWNAWLYFGWCCSESTATTAIEER